MKICSGKHLVVLIFFVLFFITESGTIKDIKKSNNLENYSQIKDIVIEKVIDYNNYNRNGKYVYETSKNIPFSGVVIKRNKKGSIEGIYFYINGQRNGRHYEYYENGTLKLVIDYENDLKNGVQYEYSNNSKLLGKIKYKNKKIVEMKRYHKNSGVISGEYQIDGDKIKVKGYNVNGIKVLEGEGLILDHQKVEIVEDGIVQSFYPNGKVKTDVLMKDGKGNGPLKTYYENGTLQLDTTVEDGKIKGTLTFYYPNGNKQLRMDYLEGISNEDGLINGNVEIYYQNGGVQYKGYFDNVKVSMLLKEEYGDIKNNKEFIKLLKRFM